MRTNRVLQIRRARRLAAVLVLASLGSCGSDGPGIETTTIPTGSQSFATSTTISVPPLPTTTSTSTVPSTTSTDSLATIDALCTQAMSDIVAISVYGDSPEDFAIQEYAVSQILYELASSLAAVGADDLAVGAEGYAASRAGLAIAYEQNLLQAVDDAMVVVEQAAADFVGLATMAGSTACATVPDAG